jgi:uncharacterized SAM-binding protein YcdF (DUF218 family)
MRIFTISKNGFLFCCLLLFSGCNAYYERFYTDPDKCFEVAKIKKPYDAIIVPGFTHDSGRVNIVLSQRIKWAYYLYKNGFTKNIIFSGSAVRSPYIEAKVMRLLALELGIKDENIFIETRAEHTTENLYYSTLMAKELGFESIAFATEPAQCSFMKPFKRKFKLKLDFLPVVMDSLVQLNIQLDPINEISAFVPNFISLNKREGFLKSFRGTRGYKVKKEIQRVRKIKRKHTKKHEPN